MLVAVVLALAVQDSATQLASANRGGNGTAEVRAIARAFRTDVAPRIDGRDDDAIWRTAEPITGFRQWQPREDGDPRYRTEARVAYDDRYIYVHVRAFDPHPDSIPSLLARRDVWTAADKIWVMIDSYHDRRSGFEFGVNPAGVKFDMAITNDGNEDDAWDAIWDVATTVDSLGWTAEYRIPLSQLRYPRGATTMGFMVIRDLQRYTERDSWPLLRRSRPGFPSQFGELHGFENLGTPRRLEATPYVVSRNAPVARASGTGFDHDTEIRAGGDLKFGITPNMTLDATVNPDFGQVEADPSVLNLSAFETFFQERRPFFIEGTGIWNFEVNCNTVNCSGENLFYSRRIGRSPQLGGLYFDPNAATASTILGAAKVSGRLGGGLSIGVLDAVTRSEEGDQGRTIEPMTNYMATRLQQDFRAGNSGIGAMITSVHRDLDQWTLPYLRRDAYVGALDFRHRFANRRFELSGSLDFSRVSGTREAITATQRSPVHFFQRPDGGTAVDTMATELTGDAQEIKFSKVGGQLTRFQTAIQRRSAGFEVNDLGFLRRADQTSWSTWFAFQFNNPTSWYRRANWNFNWWQHWTASTGMATERAFNTNVHAQFTNRWWAHAGGTISGIGSPLCDFDCTRGGPALRQDVSISPWFGFNGDDRKFIMPEWFFNFGRSDGGRSTYFNTNYWMRVRLSQRLQPSIGLSYTRNRNDTQPRGFYTSGADSSYVFSRMDQQEYSLNLRFDYTFTPTLSVQVYAAPFISKGRFSDDRELDDPRAADYDGRFQPETSAGILSQLTPGFNFKQFRSNVVLRWEYRPGSTLFFVWTQGRQDFQDAEGTSGLRRNFQNIYDLRPDNVFLVKASYWFSW